MKTKRALLIVEPTKKALERFSSVFKNPSKQKYRGYIILSFPSYEVLGKIITGPRLELLSAIKNHNPQSIQELARIVKRDIKNVHGDVKILVEYGLIDLKSNGPRKASLPIAKFTEFLIAA